MKGSDRRERSFDTAESETLGMWGSSMRGNREALQTPTLPSSVGRSKKAKSRNVDMHVCGESDGLIVPTKRANKAGAEALAAESAEGRRATKGNAPQAHSCRTQSRGSESQRLWCVRQAAKSGRPSDEPAVRAVGGNSSRTDLWGRPLARAVPTATDRRKRSGDARIELISPSNKSCEICLRRSVQSCRLFAVMI